MTNDPRRTVLGPILAVGLAAVQPVAAEPSHAADRWEFAGELFLWGAGIGGTPSAGDDVDISFGDLIDNLDFAVMGIMVCPLLPGCRYRRQRPDLAGPGRPQLPVREGRCGDRLCPSRVGLRRQPHL